MTQTHQQTPEEFLMGGGYRSFKFETTGQVAKGKIVDLTMQQQRDFKTKALKYWDDGRPMMQLRVVLETGERDGEDDDGLRAVYIKGESQRAVKEAVLKAGAEKLDVGGVLALAYTGLGEAKNGLNPPKLFRAQYQPPTDKPAAAIDEADLI